MSRTELTLNPSKGITIAPFRFRPTPSPHWRTAESDRKSRLSRLGSSEKVEKGGPNRECYHLGGATVKKPISSTKKKEKHEMVKTLVYTFGRTEFIERLRSNRAAKDWHRSDLSDRRRGTDNPGH